MPVNRTKTIAVGTSAVDFDPATEFFSGALALHRWLMVKNRGTTGIGVNPFNTAVIDGSDTEFLSPGSWSVYPRGTLSIISDGPDGKVEVSGDGGRAGR